MTEPTVSTQDIIVRPSRARPRRVKSQQEIAWEKRVTRVVNRFVIAAMTPVFKDIASRLVESEHRCRELERKHLELTKTIETEVFRYRGCWVQDKTYRRGSVVTHAGGLWFCEDTSDTRPGTDGSWRLAVKRGAFDDKPRRGP